VVREKMNCQFRECGNEATLPLEIDLPVEFDATASVKTFKSNVCEMHWTAVFIANEPSFVINAINNGDLEGTWN
jgi:hypothetical protein